MGKNFLDYTGLTKYTAKLEEFVLNKIANLVPTSRTVNGKALTTNITLTAEDVGAQAFGDTPEVGFGTPTASVDANIGTPSVTVTSSGPDSAKVFNFEFKNLKGATGAQGPQGPKGATGAQGPAGATPDLSAYAPKASPVFTGSISLGRKDGTTVGTRSVAVGSSVEASESYSHAEGYGTVASGNSSHAEGNSANATAIGAHAEGAYTIASGEYAHAEGGNTTASGHYSHSEGRETNATNYGSHAAGKYSKAMTGGASYINLVGDVFIVGNGTKSASLSNALRLAYEGTLYLTKAYNSSGADYAEYFEWLDGNPFNEDRVGRFVTLEGNKIRLASEGDYVLGVISGQPCVIGNADEDWLGRWMHDDFNRFVKEYLVHNEVEVTPPANLNENELHLWITENEIEERNGHYFKMETEVVDYPTNSWRHKANPSYDASQPYIERKDRQEWDAVGMVGVLSVIDDGTCEVNSYCKVTSDGIATKAESRIDAYRVIARITPNIVKIVLK